MTKQAKAEPIPWQICKTILHYERKGFDVKRVLQDAIDDCLVDDPEHYRKGKPEKIQEERG